MEDDRHDPYAPPVEPYVPPVETKVRVRRPASVKWAIGIMTLASSGGLLVYTRAIAKYGIQVLTEYPLTSALDALRFFVTLALPFAGRKPWVLWSTACVLAIQIFNLGKHALNESLASPRDVGGSIAYIVFGGLMVVHFARFTFGKPSREYFKA